MDFRYYGFCILGIVISVLLPILWQSVNTYFPKPKGLAAASIATPDFETVWKLVMPYFLLGLASALTAALILALVGKSVTSPEAAVIAGYAWDSTLQKFKS